MIKMENFMTDVFNKIKTFFLKGEEENNSRSIKNEWPKNKEWVVQRAKLGSQPWASKMLEARWWGELRWKAKTGSFYPQSIHSWKGTNVVSISWTPS